ncbi:MAG: right-handed parallel beta-helix repeat-containing protein [Lachnospiraceae bacterium]|nr:right-handed parallel beta-helix repeat-containing protein [Lachnospiraceae bacterium]
MKILVSNTAQFYAALKEAEDFSEDIIIQLGAGEYNIYESIEIQRDNISIVGEGDDTVIKGSKRVEFSECERQGNIVKIDLQKWGISDYGYFGLGPFRDFWADYDIPKPHMTEEGPGIRLYYNDEEMFLSRYPRSGYTKVNKAVGKTDLIRGNERFGSIEGELIPFETEIFDREDFSNIFLVGYWNCDWKTQRHNIKNYSKETKIISIEEPFCSGGYLEYIDENRCGKFYILNTKTTMEEPGDWYLDRKKGIVYMIPYEGQEYVDVSCCGDIFQIAGRKNISIENLTLTQTKKCAVNIKNSENVQVKNCNIYNVGAWGIIADDSGKCLVDNCVIHHVGGGGIALSGGDRNRLLSCGNTASNNTIHDIAIWHKTYMAGVELSGVGCTAAGNRIYDVPHFGIVFNGNNHMIERNEISNACFESNDAGAIYAGKDWAGRGNVIRYNNIHDLPGGSGLGCVAIYFDDGFSSAEVYGNVVSNVPFTAILLGGGRDFKIHDNIFYNCKISVMMDNRVMARPRLYERLEKYLNDVEYKSEVWKKAYPELYVIMDENQGEPSGNEFYDNIVVGGDGLALCKEDIKKFMAVRGNRFVSDNKNEGRHRHAKLWYHIFENDN